MNSGILLRSENYVGQAGKNAKLRSTAQLFNCSSLHKMQISGEFHVSEKYIADPNNIREMNLSDLKSVEEIWLKGVKEAHKEFIPTGFWDSRISSFKEETQGENTKERYVYEENRNIRGFITARENGYISEMYILECFQRKGIGTALFETLKGKNPKLPQLKGKYSRFTSSVYAFNYQSFNWHIKSLLSGYNQSNMNNLQRTLLYICKKERKTQ